MKICLIETLQEGLSQTTKRHNEYQAPAHYIATGRHELFTRYVTKADVKAQVDKICAEGFDLYINNVGDAAGARVSGYLASKGAICIADTWALRAKSGLHMRKAAEQCGLNVLETPRNRPQGDQFAVILIEMGHEVVPLTPIKCITIDSDLVHCDIPSQSKKLETIMDASAWDFVENEPRRKELESAAVRLFKTLGMSGVVGWARIGLFVERESRLAFVSSVDPPALLSMPGEHPTIDDLIIREKFPGGYAALLDTLIATKQIQLGLNADVASGVAAWFDKVAPTYDSALQLSGLLQVQKYMAANFDFTGEVLDLGCGTGAFGEVLHAQGVSATLTGIELSEGMIDSPNIKSHYQHPIRIGLMQDLLMNAGEFDHIVCFSALHFLNQEQLSAVLARMFMLARRSVTFESDDLDEQYMERLGRANGGRIFDFNNVQPIKNFGTPRGWRRVLWQREFLYTSPTTGTDVFGYAARFERV